MELHRDLPAEPPAKSEDEVVAKGRDLVVVIGIKHYHDKIWRTLDNAVTDAQGVQDLFTKTLNFLAPIEPLLDGKATKAAITALVQEQLHELLKPDDNLVLFFAGHGHTRVAGPQGAAIEIGFIIPVEARAGHWGDYIKISSFLEDVSQLPARHVLVILESCYAGFALSEQVKRTDRGGEVRYQHDLIKRRSRKVITSARHDQTALDGGPHPGHSLFTGTLIDGLFWGEADTDHNGLVTSSELGLYLEQRVGQASRSEQTPDSGSFYLDDRGQLFIPLSAPARLTMRQHYELGCYLFELGRLLDDSGRFHLLAFHKLETVGAHDTVIIHFPGHGFSGNQEQYLIPYDLGWVESEARGEVPNSVSASELHHLVEGIPARGKLLVLDTDANERFLELARSGNEYAVIVAAQPGEDPQEIPVNPVQPDAMAGLLTFSLVGQLRESDPEQITYGPFVAGVQSKMADVQSGFKQITQGQKPVFVGNPDWPLFGGGGPEQSLFEFAERRNYAALSASDLERLYTRFDEQICALPPQAHYSFGRAFLAKVNYPAAIQALQRAAKDRQGEYFRANVAQAVAQLHAGNESDAQRSFRQATDQREAFQNKIALMLGTMLPLLGDSKKAIEVLQRVTSGDQPEVADEAWYYLGLALAATGQPEAAAKTLAKFL